MAVGGRAAALAPHPAGLCHSHLPHPARSLRELPSSQLGIACPAPVAQRTGQLQEQQWGAGQLRTHRGFARCSQALQMASSLCCVVLCLSADLSP